MTDEIGIMGWLGMAAALGAGLLLGGSKSEECDDEGEEFEPVGADEFDDDAPEGEEEEEGDEE